MSTAALTKLLPADIQQLLVDVGAVKPSDHRILRANRAEGGSLYSSIRSSHVKSPKDAGDYDDD